MSPTEDFGSYLFDRALTFLVPIRNLNKALTSQNFLPDIDEKPFESVLKRQIETTQKQFTICFYGSFNSGKSTIINAVLKLKGAQRLSAEDSPDTAKSIRIQKKESLEDQEAKVVMKNGQTISKSWAEAKKFTSQVAINQSGQPGNAAGEVEEVSYYIYDNPILNLCDVIDLPGTGSAVGDKHDLIANERIKESELIFWVVPTSRHEVDMNELRNLSAMQDINAQVIPLINVWQDKATGVRTLVEIEELSDNIRHHYQRFFKKAPTIMIMYGREAERAHEEGREPEGYTKYTEFIDFLQNDFLTNNLLQRNERIRRVSGVLSSQARLLLQQCQTIEIVLNKKLGFLEQANEESTLARKEIRNISREYLIQIEPSAKDSADEIIQIFKEKASKFIRAKTSGLSLALLERMFNKKEVDERLKEEFKEKYLEIGVPDAPIAEEIKKFIRLATQQLRLRWQRYLEVDNKGADTNPDLHNRVNDLINNVTGELTTIATNQSADLLITALVVFGGPFGAVIGVLGLIAKRIFGKNTTEVLRRCELDTNASINRYKTSIANKLIETAENMNKDIETMYVKQWQAQQSETNEGFKTYNGIKDQLSGVQVLLQRYQGEMQEWLKTETQSN